jgi:hypothetical protein
MKRPILGLGLVFSFVGAALAFVGSGCEAIHHNLRPNSEEPTARSESDKPDDADASEAKGFFRSGRVSGAMSSEAREIERSLGVQ